jgi:hypothetical protein
LPSTRCAAALLHPPPTTTLTRLPFDAPVNPSNPRPVSPSITYFSYCSPSPPICCPRVLVAKRLDISDPITSISLHAHLACLLLLHLHLQPWCRPSVQLLAWRAAAKRPPLTSSQISKPKLKPNPNPQSPIPPIPPPRTRTESRYVLKSRGKLQQPPPSPPSPPLSLVFGRNSSAYSDPVFRPGARSAQASSGVPYQRAVTDLHQVPPRTSPLLCAQALSHTLNLLHGFSFLLRTCSLSLPQAPNVGVKIALCHRVRLQAVPIFDLHKRPKLVAALCSSFPCSLHKLE